MAKTSAMTAALAKIDAQIDDLNRARKIVEDSFDAEQPADKPKRGRKPRKGLPSETAGNV